MKRGLLIGVGTIGSLGAVFAITPPQFSSNNSTGSALGGSTTPSTPAPTPSTPAPVASTPTPTPSATKTATAPAPTKSATTKATPKATTKATPKATQHAEPTPTPSATQTQAPAPAPTPAQTQAQATGVSGTFTGNTFPASEYGRNWGDVRVTVTLKNGKISSINGQQSPASRGYMAFNQIDPYVAAQKVTIATIKSTSASALPYVSGATYSSMAYWQSLKSALQQAGI